MNSGICLLLIIDGEGNFVDDSNICEECLCKVELVNDCSRICEHGAIIVESEIEIPIKITYSWTNLARMKENYKDAIKIATI